MSRTTKADFLKEQARAEDRKCLTVVTTLADLFSKSRGSKNKGGSKQERREMMSTYVGPCCLLCILRYPKK